MGVEFTVGIFTFFGENFDIKTIHNGNISNYNLNNILVNNLNDSLDKNLKALLYKSLNGNPEFTPSRQNLIDAIKKYYENVNEVPEYLQKKYNWLFMMFDVEHENNEDVRLWICG